MRTDRSTRTGGPARPPATLADALTAWVHAGLISTAQSEAITTYERATLRSRSVAPPPRRIPRVAEALGYLGGTLALGGLTLLAARFWSDLPTAGRLAAAGVVAVALLVAGAAVPGTADPAFVRLRQIVWLAASAATAVAMVVLVRDAFGVQRAETTLLLASVVVAVESGVLWWGRRPVQLFVLLAAGFAALGGAVAHLTGPGPVGLSLVAAGAVTVFVGLRRWLPTPAVVEAAGALGGLVGAVLVTNDWEAGGFVLLVGYGLALAALALVPGPAPRLSDQIVLGTIGAMTLLQGVPAAVAYFTPHAGAVTGLVVLGLGATLLFLGATGKVRVAAVVQSLGAGAVLAGPALAWDQWHGPAPVLGTATAAGLVALGLLPDRLLLSLIGSAGLLVYVPWIIGWYFPGQGRVPILTVVAGVIVLVVAVLLTRASGRPGHHLRTHGS
jgi:hypothetical protein